MKENIKGVQKQWEKYKYVALVILAGVVLLLWPDSQEHRQLSPAAPTSPVILDIQQEMEEILGKIAGVGQVQVMLTMETDGERQLAQDVELSYSGSMESPERYERSSETIMKDGTNGDEPMIVQTQYPTYRGALIVCQGGDRADVKLAVTAAVTSLTGLTSDRISVEKWQ